MCLSGEKPGQASALIGVVAAAAAVGAVAALGRVEESVNVGVQLGDPVARHQERRQVEKIHKDFVAVTDRKEHQTHNDLFNIVCVSAVKNCCSHFQLVFINIYS